MGSIIEINDTMNITEDQGFPAHLLNREKHCKDQIQLVKVSGTIFSFCRQGARIFHLDPVRAYLVQNIQGKWLFWGQILVQSQIIAKKLEADGSWVEGNWETSGTFKIIKLYEPDYQKMFTINESPASKNYFLV